MRVEWKVMNLLLVVALGATVGRLFVPAPQPLIVVGAIASLAALLWFLPWEMWAVFNHDGGDTYSEDVLWDVAHPVGRFVLALALVAVVVYNGVAALDLILPAPVARVVAAVLMVGLFGWLTMHSVTRGDV